MANFSPKLNLIYFKNILDNSISRMLWENDDLFSKTEYGYVFSKRLCRTKLTSLIKKYIISELTSITCDFDMVSPNYFFVIGSCYPIDNILLDHTKSLSKNTTLLINKHPDIKYFLKEKDIHIDIEMFNCIFEDVFNLYFSKHSNVIKDFGVKRGNIFFIKNERLDCYTMYRVIKDYFGRVNVVNMHKKHSSDMKDVFISINEIIGTFVLDKKGICRSKNMEFYVKSVVGFIENCLSHKV